MNNTTPKTTGDNRIDAYITRALEDVRDLLNESFAKIEEAASQSDDGTSDKPIVAKCSIAIKWPAGARQGRLSTKLSYTVSHTGELESDVDADQMPLQIGGRI